MMKKWVVASTSVGDSRVEDETLQKFPMNLMGTLGEIKQKHKLSEHTNRWFLTSRLAHNKKALIDSGFPNIHRIAL